MLGSLCLHRFFPLLLGTGLWAHRARDGNTQGHGAQFANRWDQPPPPSRVGWEESNDVAARRPPTGAPEGQGWGGGVSRQPLSYGHFSHCFVFITTRVALQVNTALSGPEQPVLGRLSTQGPDWV